MSEQTSIVSILRAMALNYGKRGHSWDHLDGEAVTKAADQIDALHAEAEGLRAENERLIEYSRQQQEHQEKTEGRLDAVTGERNRLNNHCVELRAELEAARGLLREAAEDVESWGAYASAYFQEKHDLAGCAMKYRIAGTVDQGDGGAEQAAIAAMPLTATPAPEVPGHIEHDLTMAEQGERQEAVAWRLINGLGEVMTDWHDGPPPDNFVDLCGQAMKDVRVELAFSTPQPGPDVRGLVEALETCLEIEERPAVIHSARLALAAHRKANQ